MVMETEARRAHVLMVTMPYAGHFLPFVQIIYQLSKFKNVTVTLLGYKDRLAELANAQAKGYFGELDLRMLELFKEIPVYELDPVFPTRSSLIVKSSRREFDGFWKDSLEAEQIAGASSFTSVISDFCQWWTKDFADDLGVPWFTYHSTPAWWLIGALEIDRLVAEGLHPQTSANRSELLSIPGLTFTRVRDLSMEYFEDPEYYKAIADRSMKATGIVLNMADELDALGGTLDIVREHIKAKQNKPVAQVLPIGPLLQFPGFGLEYLSVELSDSSRKCLQWLDRMPSKSVLFVAFGTLGCLPAELCTELANGLEASGVPFVWVVKVPTNTTLDQALPSDFLERTQGRGFVHTGYAPQSKILSHPAVGGFLSHCGWNSVQESICGGVPMIAWPISADQHPNARYVVDVWKAGLALKTPEDNRPATADQVAKAVKLLMLAEDGKLIRRNASELQSVAKKSVENGGSYTALQTLLDQLVNV